MTNHAVYLYALAHGRRLRRVRGVYGRIVRTTDGVPTRLAEDEQRKVVMVMGPHGLQQLLGASGYQALVKIGYTPEYIARNLGLGRKFKLVLFDKPPELRVATWRVAVEVVSAHYPELRTQLFSVLEDLKSRTIMEFERESGYSFAEVQANGPSDPRFMTAQRLHACVGTATEVRHFLFHTLYFSELYAGDGYTKTHEGKRGVREYLMPNVFLKTLNNLHIVDLEVEIPQLTISK